MRQSFALFLLLDALSLVCFLFTGLSTRNVLLASEDRARRAYRAQAIGMAIAGCALILGSIVNYAASKLTQDVWFGLVVSAALLIIGLGMFFVNRSHLLSASAPGPVPPAQP
jgi:hypothetical protein